MTNHYKKRQCAYCGSVTGINQGDHVVPGGFYPDAAALIDPKLQWAKVSTCPKCNTLHSQHEGHAKNILVPAGPNPSPARDDRWASTLRSFEKPISGRADVKRLWDQMVVVQIEGQTRLKVYPGRNEDVLYVVRKIVRGMTVWDEREQWVADDRVSANLLIYTIPRELDRELKPVYEVEKVAKIRATPKTSTPLPSFWHLRLFEVEFLVAVDHGSE